MTSSAPTTATNDSRDQNETLASSVFQRLRNDILTGKLEPGRKLRLQSLTESYAVGNSPLREALNRLSVIGLVQREENKGFRVSPASIEELQELTRTRCWLEEIALRRSIENGDTGWEERIVLAFHRLSRLEESDGDGPFTHSPEWEGVHRDYHLALLSACDSNILIDYCAQLQEQTFRYRNLAEVVEYRAQHEGTEHHNIQEAVLNRDADPAVRLLKAHYEITANIVAASGSLN